MKKVTKFDIEEIPLLCKSLRALGEVRFRQERDENVRGTLENAAQIFECLSKEMSNLKETFLPAAKANRKKFLKERKKLEEAKSLISRLVSEAISMHMHLANDIHATAQECNDWNKTIVEAERFIAKPNPRIF